MTFLSMPVIEENIKTLISDIDMISGFLYNLEKTKAFNILVKVIDKQKAILDSFPDQIEKFDFMNKFNLLCVDINSAIENNDLVLLNDLLRYGIKELNQKLLEFFEVYNDELH